MFCRRKLQSTQRPGSGGQLKCEGPNWKIERNVKNINKVGPPADWPIYIFNKSQMFTNEFHLLWIISWDTTGKMLIAIGMELKFSFHSKFNNNPTSVKFGQIIINNLGANWVNRQIHFFNDHFCWLNRFRSFHYSNTKTI